MRHVSKESLKKHRLVWNEAIATINSQLQTGKNPTHYFQDKSKSFDTFSFLSKSRQGINLQQLYLSIGLDIILNAEDWCVKAKNYMVRNHLWNNRTYKAEEGLGAMVAGMEEDNLTVYLYHSVPYGVYLEKYRFPHAGLLAVIEPTLDHLGPDLVKSLQGALR